MVFGQQDTYGQVKAESPLGYRLSQYMLHQPFINPAALGSYETFTAAAFYRNQWTGIEGSPNTQGLDITAPLNDVNYIGGQITRDNSGGVYDNRYKFDVNYAFRLKLTDKDFLSLGLSAGGEYVSNDYGNLSPIAPDPSIPTGIQTAFAPDMRLGAYYFRDKIYAGLAMNNLFSTDYSDQEGDYVTELNMEAVEYLIHGGISIPFSNYWDLDVSSLVKYRKGSDLQADFNALFVFDKTFGFGAAYRTSNELALMANFRFLDHFRLGYAYETIFGKLQNSNGTHEVMLIYQLASPRGSAITVPRF